MKKSTLYYESKMEGAYSDITTRKIIIITEHDIGDDDIKATHSAYDAPIYTQVEQDEFTPEMATETNEFC